MLYSHYCSYQQRSSIILSTLLEQSKTTVLHVLMQQAPPTGPPKLIVFGGRGFLGSAVCREALRTGLHVVSISPSGAARSSSDAPQFVD
jgi:hypothetical protein